MTEENSSTSRPRAQFRSARAAWAALWTGRLRVSHMIDGAGKRYLALVPQEASILSHRQREVARALACGFAEIDIARALGVAPSTVATYAGLAAARMGLSILGLCYLLPASALPEGLTVQQAIAGPLPCPVPRGATWDGRRLAFPLPPAEVPGSLSEAEREVLRGLLNGLSQAEIGRLRRTSVRTVANQAASVYRKLNVSGRRQLDPGMRASLGGAS